MKVFLGWSGDRSKAMASALHQWLPIVLHYVEPWMSQNDIAAGERWSQELANELGQSNFGIISVTQDNINEPWIQFEAGSLAKSLEDGRVIPFLLDLDISDVSGPLAQFQSKKAAKDGAWDIICGINKCAATTVSESRARQLFELAWPDLEKRLSDIPASSSAKPRRQPHEVLEELVTSVRSFDARLSRIEDIVEDGRHQKSRHGRRFLHPGILEEIQVMVGEGPSDPIWLLAVGSMFRDEFPPLAEICTEAYRAFLSGRNKDGAIALKRLSKMADFWVHGPMREEFGGTKQAYIMMRDLLKVVDMLGGKLLRAVDNPIKGDEPN